MKSLSQWFADYAVCHQNETNKSIHYVCVPAIFLSLVGLIMSIPSGILSGAIPFQSPIFINWASVLLIFLLVFYFRLSIKLGFQMLLFSVACLVINFFIGQFLPLWLFSVAVFVIAWIGQFYGHKIEGKKPSFFNDLQFLLIGPAWVIDNLMSKLK